MTRGMGGSLLVHIQAKRICNVKESIGANYERHRYISKLERASDWTGHRVAAAESATQPPPSPGKPPFRLCSPQPKTRAIFCIISLPNKLLPLACGSNHGDRCDVVAPSVSAKIRRQDQNKSFRLSPTLQPLHPPTFPPPPQHSNPPSFLVNPKVCALLILPCFIKGNWRVFSEEFT